jgi:hypothetical protein
MIMDLIAKWRHNRTCDEKLALFFDNSLRSTANVTAALVIKKNQKNMLYWRFIPYHPLSMWNYLGLESGDYSLF